jgi:soluble lytic murein transglycosylase-like protein
LLTFLIKLCLDFLQVLTQPVEAPAPEVVNTPAPEQPKPVVTIPIPAVLPPKPYLEYRQLIHNAAQEAQVPEGFIVGLIHTESNWNVYAKSPAGAVGLGQFMPATAQDLSNRYAAKLHPVNYYDANWQFAAIAIYVKELDWLHEREKMYSVRCNRLGSIASAYNGGFRWAKKRWELSGKSEDFWGTVRKINPGILESAQKENQGYPVKIYVNQGKYPVEQFCK